MQANVTIVDVNDNRPIFSSMSGTTLPVAENTGLDAVLYTVRATDADSGLNGRVRYQLTGNTGSIFKINSVTGALQLQVSADRACKCSFCYCHLVSH